VNKNQHLQPRKLGQLKMPCTWRDTSDCCASVMNGASVIYSWVLDWTGLNKGCLFELLGIVYLFIGEFAIYPVFAQMKHNLKFDAFYITKYPD
jgi:hypothetical protein